MSENEKTFYRFFKKLGYTDAAICALMGNVYYESSFIPNNLQNTYNSAFGISDDRYTDAVDRGIRNFIDGAGYGLCQWTYHSRKENLLNYARSMQMSVGNMELQMNFIHKEIMENFAGLKSMVFTCNDIARLNREILCVYENPAREYQSPYWINKRLDRCKYYFDNLKTVEPETALAIDSCKIVGKTITIVLK